MPSSPRRGERRRGAARRRDALAPGRNDATVLQPRLDAECGARSDEAPPDPLRVVALRQPRVRVLQLERDRLQSVAVQLDKEEQSEVVAQLGLDGVVVEKVAEVVE